MSSLPLFCKNPSYDERVINSFVRQKSLKWNKKVLEKEIKKNFESNKQINQKNTDDNVNIETNIRNNSKGEEEKKTDLNKDNNSPHESHTNFDLWTLNLQENYWWYKRLISLK